MAKAFSILLLFVCVGFVYLMLYQSSPTAFGGKQLYFNNLTDTNGTFKQFSRALPFSVSTTTGLTALATAALTIATVVFPNPYTLYAIPAAALWTLYNAFSDVITGVGLPQELNYIVAIIGFMFLVYLMGWHKGNE